MHVAQFEIRWVFRNSVPYFRLTRKSMREDEYPAGSMMGARAIKILIRSFRSGWMLKDAKAWAEP